MKISVPKKKWAQTMHQRSFQKLANHVARHYPMDRALHKAVRDTFKSMDNAAMKLAKSAKKSAPKRTRKSTAKRRTTARRATKRTTARKSTPKRTTARKRTAPKRRTTARRTTARRGNWRRRRAA